MKGAIDVQDDYNRFIRRSMKQAQCNYEDIFSDNDTGISCGCGEMPDSDMSNSCGCDEMPDNDMNTSCGCEMNCQTVCEKKCEKNLPVMAFVEIQPFGRMYNEAEALCRGTLFPALDKPFTGRGGCRG